MTDLEGTMNENDSKYAGSRAARAGAVCALATLALGGCGGATGGNGGGTQGRMPVPVTTTASFSANPKLDVLFVVDNSTVDPDFPLEVLNSASPFVAQLGAATVGGSAVDLHVGMVTTDLGAGASGAPGCTTSGPGLGGDKGVLKPVAKGAPQGCVAPIGAPYIRYAGAQSNNLGVSNLTDQVSCMLRLGSTTGCGLRHTLEAARAALTNTVDNAGFLRPDAALAVIFITRRDDCSGTPDSLVFDKNSVATLGYESLYRCARYGITCGGNPLPYGSSNGPLQGCAPRANPNGDPSLLYDVQRYIDFFSKPSSQGGVKDDPSKVLLAALAGDASPVEVILTNPGTPVNMALPTCTPLNDQSNPPCTPLLQTVCSDRSVSVQPAVRLGAVVSAASHVTASACEQSAPSSFFSDLQTRLLGQGTPGGTFGCIPFPVSPSTPDCVVTDTAPGGNGVDMPQCSDPPTTYPCFQVVSDARCAGQGAGLGITVRRNGASPAQGTVTSASCRPAPPDMASGGGGGGGNKFSCDETIGGQHTCIDYSWSGGAFTTDAWKSSCAQAGGTTPSSCNHAGGTGGCKVTASNGGVTISTTTWYFGVPAATVMMVCTQAKGTFLSP